MKNILKDLRFKWWSLKSFFKSGLAKDVILGYKTKEGEPIKCPHCKCKKIETYETFRHDQGFVEEFWVRCDNCKEPLGVWAYGSWTL